jgi:5-methylcytosine-specific restriction endonuclease McrA
MRLLSIFNPAFSSHKVLLNEIDTDFYTGRKIERNSRSTEHLLPKSKGGKSNITNYVMADKKINNTRGNMPLDQFLSQHPDFITHVKEYLEKYKYFKIDNINHGEQIQKTLKSLNIII